MTGRIGKFSSSTLKNKTQQKQIKTPGNQKNQKSRLELFSSWTRNQNMPTGAFRTSKTSSLFKFSLQEEDIESLHYLKKENTNSNLPPTTKTTEGATICHHPTASQEIETVQPTRRKIQGKQAT